MTLYNLYRTHILRKYITRQKKLFPLSFHHHLYFIELSSYDKRFTSDNELAHLTEFSLNIYDLWNNESYLSRYKQLLSFFPSLNVTPYYAYEAPTYM